MGSGTNLAQREVEAQRAHIAPMLAELEQRVQDDVQHVQDAAGDRASALKQRVTGAVDGLPGASTLDEQVTSHPLTALFGGFSAGVALGLASTALSDDDEEVDDDRRAYDRRGYDRRAAGRGGSRNRRSRASAHDGGTGLIGVFTSLAASSMAGPFKSELQKMAREAISGFFSGTPAGEQRSAARAPRPRTAARERASGAQDA